MEKRFDIYITFPDELSQISPVLGETIHSYISNLTDIVERILPFKLKVLIKGRDFTRSNYRQFFEFSSLFLFFVHPLFEKNESYEEELSEICNFLRLDQLDPSKGFASIFKVCLEPAVHALKPYCIEELNSYIFYEKNSIDRKIKNLNFGSRKNNQVIYGKLLDLSYDISSVLMDSKNNKAIQTEPQGFIYLGLTNADQQESRDDLRRELQQIGYKVLPFANMPADEASFKQVLFKYLEISDSVIQLIGTQYGEIPKGFKYSIPDLQNRIINEYKAKDILYQQKYFIWLPSGKMIHDQRQSLHLKRIKNESGNHTEIIETPLESFKTILVNRLKNAKESKKVEYGNIFKVYLISEEKASKNVDNLYSTLSSSGLKVLTLDFSTQIGIYARHLQKLRDCDSVIIFQQEESQLWLDSKIRDIIKSPGIGRIKPFKKVVIVAKNIPDERLLKLINTRTEVILDTKCDVDLILQKLISE